MVTTALPAPRRSTPLRPRETAVPLARRMDPRPLVPRPRRHREHRWSRRPRLRIRSAAAMVAATRWVNYAHPAYRRAAASRSEGYHVALATALALAAVAVEPARERAFVTAFLTSWGGALERRRSRRRR